MKLLRHFCHVCLQCPEPYLVDCRSGLDPVTAEDIEWLAQKVAHLRVFADQNGMWNLNVQETGGSVLVVSQFTLFASTKKGTKPSWHRAASAETATEVCDFFIKALSKHLPGRVESGEFGAMMDVALVNDGPVTLIIDTKARE